MMATFQLPLDVILYVDDGHLCPVFDEQLEQIKFGVLYDTIGVLMPLSGH